MRNDEINESGLFLGTFIFYVRYGDNDLRDRDAVPNGGELAYEDEKLAEAMRVGLTQTKVARSAVTHTIERKNNNLVWWYVMVDYNDGGGVSYGIDVPTQARCAWLEILIRKQVRSASIKRYERSPDGHEHYIGQLTFRPETHVLREAK